VLEMKTAELFALSCELSACLTGTDLDYGSLAPIGIAFGNSLSTLRTIAWICRLRGCAGSHLARIWQGQTYVACLVTLGARRFSCSPSA